MSGGNGPVGGGTLPVAAAGLTATVLPTTGASTLLTIALAVAAGLVVWGVAYMALRKKAN